MYSRGSSSSRHLILSRECVISLVLSHRSKDLKQQTSITPQLQLSFIWQAKENKSSRYEGGLTQKKRGAQFGPLFIYVFLLSLSLPYANWASQEGCLFPPSFSLSSSDFLLFHFRRLCLSLSFSHGHFGLIFPILTT